MCCPLILLLTESGRVADHQSQLKRFHSALGFRFPLPRAGEGQGEGVAGRSSHQRSSLTLALSQREREKMHEHWRKALSCDLRLQTRSYFLVFFRERVEVRVASVLPTVHAVKFHKATLAKVLLTDPGRLSPHSHQGLEVFFAHRYHQTSAEP